MLIDLELLGRIAGWIWHLMIVVGIPLFTWLARKWTRPLVELNAHVTESRAHWAGVDEKLGELATHVAKQNGRVSALESRFHDHSQQDKDHQQQIHADLREMFLRMSQAFNMTCFVPNCQHPNKLRKAQFSLGADDPT